MKHPFIFNKENQYFNIDCNVNKKQKYEMEKKLEIGVEKLVFLLGYKTYLYLDKKQDTSHCKYKQGFKIYDKEDMIKIYPVK